MNKIEKLLKKISKKDREALFGLLDSILRSDNKIKTIKIKNTDFYRLRYGLTM